MSCQYFLIVQKQFLVVIVMPALLKIEMIVSLRVRGLTVIVRLLGVNFVPRAGHTVNVKHS